MDRKDMIERLRLASLDLLANGITNGKFYIGGASALLIHIDARGTDDIDLVQVESIMNNDVRKILRQYQINDDVITSTNPYLIENYGYPDRLSFEEPTLVVDNLEWFTVYPEVVLVSKLISLEREKDKRDLKSEKILNQLSKERMLKSLDIIFERRKDGYAYDPDESWIRKEAMKLVER